MEEMYEDVVKIVQTVKNMNNESYISEEARYIKIRSESCRQIIQPVLDILFKETNDFAWAQQESYNIAISLSFILNEYFTDEMEMIEKSYEQLQFDIDGVLEDFRFTLKK